MEILIGGADVALLSSPFDFAVYSRAKSSIRKGSFGIQSQLKKIIMRDLSQACRANLKYPDDICDSVVNKSIHNIDCSEFESRVLEKNVIHLFSDRSQVYNDTLFINGTRILPEYNPDNITVLFDIPPLEPEVCEAEAKSQRVEAQTHAYTSSLQSIFPVILILFAASWSDKRGHRKICMLMPMLGELASNFGEKLIPRYIDVKSLKRSNLFYFQCC